MYQSRVTKCANRHFKPQFEAASITWYFLTNPEPGAQSDYLLATESIDLVYLYCSWHVLKDIFSTLRFRLFSFIQ